MNYELIIKPKAELDITESAEWYEDQKKGLGSRFVDTIENKLHQIQKNPRIYQIRYKNTRFDL